MPASQITSAAGRCFREIRVPLLTTWPAFTEAMYLLGRAGGWPGQEALWRLVLREDLLIAEAQPDRNRRAWQLMKRLTARWT